MNYITKTSFAEAAQELSRVRNEGFKAYMLEMRSDFFEVRYWRI